MSQDAATPAGAPFRRVVMMGPSGCGKSTVGTALAEALGYAFLEGDGLHSAANRDRMAHGVPLTDADRLPWLDAIGSSAGALLSRRAGVVIACSALKKAYRQRLAAADRAAICFVMLGAPRELLESRMRARVHFMPAALLDSQLATLERPGPDEPVLWLDAAEPVEMLVRRAVAFVRTRAP